MTQRLRIPGIVLLVTMLTWLQGCGVQPPVPSNNEVIACSQHTQQGQTNSAAQMNNAASGHVMVVAHRACWANHPENSIGAIDACIALGVDMIEIDVRQTADGELVLMHDETLDRTTDGSGRVSDISLHELRSLFLRRGAGGSGAALTQEKVPTLREALMRSQGKILVNIDAKEDVIPEALELVWNLGLGDEVLMKSADSPDEIEADMASVYGAVLFMPIVAQERSGKPLSEVISEYTSTNPIAFEVLFDDREWFREGSDDLLRSNLRAWVNTMKPIYSAGLWDSDAVRSPDAVWGELVNDGANMIQTDKPAEAIAYLQSTGRRCIDEFTARALRQGSAR